MALAYMGLKPATSGGKMLPDSADPTWLDRESPPTVPIASTDHDSAVRSDVSLHVRCQAVSLTDAVSLTLQAEQL